MSTKTDNKKQLIIEKATEVFKKKGFLSVTMKDVVEACQISRGGLYLYYSSTEEIFKDVLAAEEAKEIVEKKADFASMKAIDLLLWFTEEQKKQIIEMADSIAIAKYEYTFFNRRASLISPAKDAFDTAVSVLENIIERGIREGTFACEDVKAVARNIMYSIEGMKMCSASFGMSEKKINSGLLYIMQQLEVE